MHARTNNEEVGITKRHNSAARSRTTLRHVISTQRSEARSTS
jgi:hypothetical protein